MGDFGVPGTEDLKRGYRKTSNMYVFGAWTMIALAIAAPFLACIDYRPSFESAEVWIQRSGALTTILALLTNQLKDMGSRTLHVPGTWGDAVKLEVLAEFERSFDRIFWVAFILTIIGTLIWGYGDTAYKYFYLGLS